MFESIAAFWAEYGNVLTDGVWDTLVMVVISTAFAYLIGLPLGVALILTQPHGIRPHRGVYRVLDWIVNIGRSVPFIILMVAIMPFTRMVVGTTIGRQRRHRTSGGVRRPLHRPDGGDLPERGRRRCGRGRPVHGRLHPPDRLEGVPAGGEALFDPGGRHLPGDDSGLYRHRWHRGRRRPGDIAVRYGHQRGITSVMWVTVVFLIILVQVVQLIFNWLSRRIDKRLDQPSGAKKSAPSISCPAFAHTK